MGITIGFVLRARGNMFEDRSNGPGDVSHRNVTRVTTHWSLSRFKRRVQSLGIVEAFESVFTEEARR